MTGDVFKRIQILTNPLGGHELAWELWPGMASTSDFHFYVDFGRPGTDEWEVLNDIPIVNLNTFIDAEQRHWDQLADFYYRVRLVLPTDLDTGGQAKVYLSRPQQANGIWSKKDWLTAREIARKEYLYQRKAVNKMSSGYLLKRRRWGTRNPGTTEWDTGEVRHTASAVDFGTGFIGGYYPAVDFTFTLINTWNRKFQRDENVSMKNDIIRQGRAVAYPYLDTDDVYVRRDTGDRYVVHGIQNAAEVGGIPVVVVAELRLAPTTDIIYNIPLVPVTSSSSSQSSQSSAPAEPEKEAGLNETGQW
jgi:hypothetical protein